MSTFERGEYKWRETYFVLFDSAKRPSLKKIERVLHDLNDRFELSNALADEDGRFESITVMSEDDYAALDISYEVGEEVVEQGAALYDELKGSADDDEACAGCNRCASTTRGSTCCTSSTSPTTSPRTKPTKCSTPARC